LSETFAVLERGGAALAHDGRGGLVLAERFLASAVTPRKQQNKSGVRALYAPRRREQQAQEAKRLAVYTR